MAQGSVYTTLNIGWPMKTPIRKQIHKKQPSGKGNRNESKQWRTEIIFSGVGSGAKVI